MGARRPTDQVLLFDVYRPRLPTPVGDCFKADGRRARFLIKPSAAGDRLLEQVTKRPARLARPYGCNGWVLG